MLDIQFIRDNADLVQTKAAQKGYKINVSELLELDAKRRSSLTQIDELRAQRNTLADTMKGQKPSAEQVAEGKRLKEEIASYEAELKATEEEYLPLLKSVPNMPLDSVPVGVSEDENVVTRTVGEQPKFDFTPKNHWEIAEAKDWIDKDRAAKIAGARFVYLKGDLVRLELALWQYAMDVLGNSETLQQIIDDAGLRGVSNKPFVPVVPPAVARTEVFQATGRLNKEEQHDGPPGEVGIQPLDRGAVTVTQRYVGVPLYDHQSGRSRFKLVKGFAVIGAAAISGALR